MPNQLSRAAGLAPMQSPKNWLLSAGAANRPRPLRPGESMQGPAGEERTEYTSTITDSRVNDGRATLIPTIWMIGDKPTQLSPERAIEMVLQSQTEFPSFSSVEGADIYARQRSQGGGVYQGQLGSGY